MHLPDAETMLRTMGADSRLIAFGRALDEANGGLDWPYFLEKPWKWSNEYKSWLALGAPVEDDPTWNDFCEALL